MELSIGEMLMIALAIVVLFGPDKLPEIARGLGEGVRKMRGAVDDIKTEIMKEADNPVSEIKKEIEK
jgi:sec-independent protein translocase protein TatB